MDCKSARATDLEPPDDAKRAVPAEKPDLAANWARPSEAVAIIPTVSEPWNEVGSDFLGEEARKQLRNLDIVAVLSILVVILNLVPNRISAVGVEFGPTRKQSFLIVLLVFDFWFIVRFTIYALSDFGRFRHLLKLADEEESALIENREARIDWVDGLLAASGRPSDLVEQIDGQVIELSNGRMRRRTLILLRRFGYMRAVVDLLVPIALGVGALVLVLVKLI